MLRRWKSRGVTGTPGTACPMNPFLTFSWTPGADEHQERGGWIGGGHAVTKPMLLRLDLRDLNYRLTPGSRSPAERGCVGPIFASLGAELSRPYVGLC